MKETNDGLYFQSFELNQVIRSGSVGKVVASANPEFEVGDIVFGFFEVSEYVIVQGGVLRKIDRNEL